MSEAWKCNVCREYLDANWGLSSYSFVYVDVDEPGHLRVHLKIGPAGAWKQLEIEFAFSAISEMVLTSHPNDKEEMADVFGRTGLPPIAHGSTGHICQKCVPEVLGMLSKMASAASYRAQGGDQS